MIYQNLKAMKSEIHPRIYAILEALDNGTAPGVKYDFLEKLRILGAVIRIEKVYRSWEEQEQIMKTQDPSNPKTNAEPGASYHQWGLAVDSVFKLSGHGSIILDGQRRTPAELWQLSGIVNYFESAGLTWGGRWSSPFDPGHIELRIKHPTEREKSGQPWWENENEKAQPKGGNVKNGIKILALIVAIFLIKKIMKPRYSLA